jgi:hypothetical protein
MILAAHQSGFYTQNFPETLGVRDDWVCRGFDEKRIINSFK